MYEGIRLVRSHSQIARFAVLFAVCGYISTITMSLSMIILPKRMKAHGMFYEFSMYFN